MAEAAPLLGERPRSPRRAGAAAVLPALAAALALAFALRSERAAPAAAAPRAPPPDLAALAGGGTGSGTQSCNESISKMVWSVSDPDAVYHWVRRYFAVT